MHSLDCFRPRSRTWVGTWLLSTLSALVGAVAKAADPVTTDATAAAVAGKPAEVDFTRDVHPILAAHCFKCHGADRQESDLRLDRREDAIKGGANGVAIVPGHSGDSPLLERIAGQDRDLRMPPKGDLLAPEAVAVIKSWIDAGAAWPVDEPTADVPKSDHWSLHPLTRPPLPELPTASALSPIDVFIRAKLAQNGLHPSAEADRRTLIRRLTFDLTGLTPTPEEVAEFVADASPDAYERVVDRLLAGPRYGERWARHWMDVVQFAETHGHDQDRPRPNAWPYRDYLIRAFNEDKPYARFVSEQVAGDVLYPDEPQVTAALGCLAAGPWDESSLASIADDTIDRKVGQLLDRDEIVTTVMSAFAGATVHCARCHNHKFDPISQADYYSLQAVFAGVDRTDRLYDADPAVHARRHALLARQQEMKSWPVERFVTQPDVAELVARAEHEFAEGGNEWQTIVPLSFVSASGSSGALQSDRSVLFGGTRPEKDTYTFTFETNLPLVTAVQLEVLSDANLPQSGPGRQDNGNLHLSEFKLMAGPPDTAATPVPIAKAAADFDQDGWTSSAAIDGNPQTAWGIYPAVGKSHAVAFVLREPLPMSAGARLTVVLEQLHGGGHLIGRARLSVTSAANPGTGRPRPPAIDAILAKPSADRSSQEQAELARFLLERSLETELAKLPERQAVYAVTRERGAGPPLTPRPIQILRRGDILQPLAAAAPGALSCIADLPARFKLSDPQDEGSRRAALAGWLTDPRNVFVWRSIVNRVWHYHFGRGIVDTPNDLGRMGGNPSHPELLDWLAVEFRDNGGSFKRLHRMIVTSAAYRQSSAIDPAAVAVDADNRLLWRMNRSRLDAESIRDSVLQVSGKLDLTMGGPSVKQFIESPGIHVTPNVDYLAFDIDAPANYRRSVYRFLFRTLPDPLMESLDCPDGSQLAPTRSASVTALQALAMLNDRLIVRQSEHTADRLQSLSPDLPEQIRRLFQVTLLRDPSADESQRWQEYATRHGLPNACRMMFNTNEFVFVD